MSSEAANLLQLSLIRARMRADVEVYGALDDQTLKPTDVALLKHCREDATKKPWRGTKLALCEGSQ